MDKETKKIKVALKPYKELNSKFTQVSNFMRQYITDPYTFKVYFQGGVGLSSHYFLHHKS